MPSFKIFMSGENIEFYAYERQTGERRDENEGYDLENALERLQGIERKTDDRKVERRKQTLRTNAMDMKRMARQYMKTDVFFLTLTFGENEQDIDKADRKVKYFFKKFREEYGETVFLGVREKQIRGALHYHFLLTNKVLANYYRANIPHPKKRGNKLIYHDLHKEFHEFLHKQFWKNGWVTNVLLNDEVDDCSAYLAKYMFKTDTAAMAWQENRRLILRSEGIKKIEALDATQYPDLFRSLVDQFEMFQKIADEDKFDETKRKRVFKNSYVSEFNGQVDYLDVNLNRLNKCNQIVHN